MQELLELGVDYAQGYLIHRPEPLGQLLAWASCPRVTCEGESASMSGFAGVCLP